MNISDKLTQQKFLDILISIYTMGQEKENIQMCEFLEEIKQRVLSIIYASD